MDSTVASKVIKAPPWMVSALNPMLARTVAGQLLKEHPTWTRAQVEEFMLAKLPQGADDNHRQFIDQVLARWPDRQVPSPVDQAMTAPAGAINWRSPALWMWLYANLMPLYGVFVLGWSVYPLLFLYWLENAIIGVATAARMLAVDPGDGATWGGKLFMVPFFCMHYGIFTLGHGAILNSLFGGMHEHMAQHGLLASQVDIAAQVIARFHLRWIVLAMAASHLLSFVFDYLGQGEYRRSSLSALMTAPYGRIIILHLTILIGGLAAQALHSPAWALVLLIAFKIGFDWTAYKRRALQVPGR